MSHRERVLGALAHQPTDRIPIAMVCAGLQPPARADLETWLQCKRAISVEQYLDPLIDIKVVGPRYIGPTLAPGTDIWGVHRAAMSYGRGSYQEIDHYPLAAIQDIDELAKHPWPRTDWFDYTAVKDEIRFAQSGGDYALMAMNGNIFESSWYMRGFEQIFLDLVLQPDLVHEIFERVTRFFIEHFTKILQAGAGEIDLVFTADDIGSQQGLLMSLDMWQEHIKPYHVRLNKAIHAYGARVIYHTDGAVMQAVPGLIDMGIDILQALQFDAEGMDPVRLKQDHGDQLCFEGGISVQKTLPFGSVEDVRAEVVERIRVLGKGGGYILGPSHAIQAGTPPDNIVAMFDAAADFSVTG